MLLAVSPENAYPADGVYGNRVGHQFTKRTQPVYELGIGGKENVIRGSIFNLLREDSAGPGYETNANWVRFFKLMT
jgi:hypothetical protein